ncbi:RNA-binding domain-containing protein [Candidatus Thiothrix sp. Deng01]|uniref:RNA-binding domain-containing protein n=1 Tax=Candidatus Thiothrix phosphatis TaxID=3112415 RepID=A0ABU6CXV0_9GAMM|nr:RNA-binding domain-containing protein [Candidatus Thiothrix sp. Deng01]MEB4590944.1 RNA-binding domain-containing protein [Candidatus Thiothrix sp. Deng01]
MNTTTDLNETINALIQQGENAQVEFKSGAVRPESAAREIVAFANTLGGSLLIGVEDDGTISGIESSLETWVANISRNNIIPALQLDVRETEIEGKRVCLITVPKGHDRPYQTQDSKYWLRVGSSNRMATKEELSRLFQQAGLVHFDTSPVANTDISHIDKQAVDHYYRSYYDTGFIDLPESEQHSLLVNTDILVESENHWVASVGGLLMFGKQPQRRLPQSAIMFAVFKGEAITDDLIDKKEITGTVAELIDKTVNLLQLYIPTPSTIKGNQRQEITHIPLKVLREAVVNAVMHRDYSISHRKTQVHVYSNRIEITSPGALANTLTLEKIRYGNSAPRNIFLVKFLDNLRYFDGLGRGIPMMLKAMQERIELENIGELFRLTL